MSDDILDLLAAAMRERPDLLDSLRARIEAKAAPAADPTFGELWAVYARERGPDLAAWKSVYKVHALHLLPFFGSLRASECTREKADEYVRLRRTERNLNIKDPKKQRRPSITTIDHELATAKAMFQWHLVERRSISFHPLTGYKIKLIKEDLRTIQDRKFYLPEDGLQKLLEELQPTPRRMMLLAFETGMRRDEIRKLEWSEVDLAAGVIRLPAERTKARQARRVPLSARALNVLERQKPASDGCRYVFPNPHTGADEPISAGTLGQQFRRACAKAGIKGPRDQNIWIHTLRKSFGTLTAMASSMPPRLLMDIMGHASEDVHREYIAMGEEHLQDARRYLDERRRGPNASPDPLKLVKDK